MNGICNLEQGEQNDAPCFSLATKRVWKTAARRQDVSFGTFHDGNNDMNIHKRRKSDKMTLPSKDWKGVTLWKSHSNGMVLSPPSCAVALHLWQQQWPQLT